MNRAARRRVAALAALLVVAMATGSSARAALEPSSPRLDYERPVVLAHGAVRSQAAEPDVDPLADADLDVLQGEAAVDELVESGTLDDVAADGGLAPQELAEEFLADPSLFLAADGLLGYADALPLDGAAPATEELTAVPPGVEVAALSSQPGAARTLYLDFDGHITSDAAWESVGAPATILSDAAGVGCSPGASAAFDAIRYEIWQRVSEDYAPFAINVTTIDPGVEAIRRASAGDQVFGQRVVITPSNWVAPGVLGIALLDSFGKSVDRPAFVFTGSASIKAIAEAVSHEAGHTFNLRHDGMTSVSSYYDGHGVWAPIMGRSTRPTAPISQWSKGEYAGADNPGEDDVAVVRALLTSSASLMGLAADDHSNTSGAATTIVPGVPAAGTIGVADVDVFALDVPAGSTLNLSLVPVAPWTNLYANITLRKGGALVASGALLPASSTWSATLAAPALTGGRYTIEVKPSSFLTVNDGFSTYGSMGAYRLSAAIGGAPPMVPPATVAPAPPPPTQNCFAPVAPDRLLDTRTGFGGSTRLAAGQTIALQVTGRGGVPAGATAAVLGVVADQPSGRGFLTTFPCTPTRPTASTLNFVRGQTVANTAISTLSSTGRLCIYAHAATDVIVDVTGWIGPAASARFTPTAPTRVADTRILLGGVARLPAGGTIEVNLSQWVPRTARAVALNVTSNAASGQGFATVYPCGSARPPTSTINFVAGETRPNNTIVGLGGRRVCIYSMTSTEIIVDLVGFFGPTGLSYLPAAPTRLLNTRDPGGIGYLPPGAAVTYRPATAALGEYSAVAAAVNVTAVEHLAGGFVTTYDCATRNTTSTVNAVVGQVNANGAIVPIASNGLDSCLFTQSGGHLVVDLNGWWVR